MIMEISDRDNLASARILEKVGMTCKEILHRWLTHPKKRFYLLYKHFG